MVLQFANLAFPLVSIRKATRSASKLPGSRANTHPLPRTRHTPCLVLGRLQTV
jgi:hypothetical protein